MPVCSDRDDVIVITDEAHRTQYYDLALNMRQALPNAGFLGFTGTPLIAGEERTREVFGDYVSIYNFRDSIEDGATVPLYYENRIPELQIVNDDFDEELTEILEEAELDEDAGAAAGAPLRHQYQLITRARAAAAVAADLVDHFVGRASPARRCSSRSTRPTAVRMYDLVSAHGRSGLQRPGRAPSAPSACPSWSGPWLAAADRVHGGDRHGRRRLPVAERDRRHGERGPRHRAAPQADARGGPRRAVQGPRDPLRHRVRLRDVDDRVRRAVAARRSTSTGRCGTTR